jgi:hypothetical protein
MAIQKEIWTQAVAEKLFSDMDYVKNSVSHDNYVDYKTVHIPQAGALPSVEKDRTVYPAPISERTDTDKEYSLSSFSIDPIRIGDVDELQVAYDKRTSVLDHHIRKLNDRLALEANFQWADPSQTTYVTTGTATANIAPPSATGNRKALTLSDLGNAAAKLDEDNVSRSNRWCVMPAKVYWSFLEENKGEILRKDYMNSANLPTGAVNQVYDFNIAIRDFTVTYTAAGARKPVGSAAATTDEWGILCYQQDYVARALGSIEVYIEENKAAYYGGLFSSEVLFGATRMYTDVSNQATGVITIKQDT